MAKDPAFLFYPEHFTTGTQFFSDEQVGKYIRLLLAQHQHGHLEEEHMIFICKSYDKHIFSKFDKDEQGKYFNQRLETEIIKRKEYSESRGKNRSSKNNISKSYDKHMVNINIDITNNKEIFETLKFELFNSAVWVSDLERTLKTKNIKMLLNQFLDDLWLKEDYFKDIKDVKSHFVNWVKLEIPKKIKVNSVDDGIL